MRFEFSRGCAVTLIHNSMPDYADAPVELEVSRPNSDDRDGYQTFAWANLTPNDARSLAVELVRMADKIDGGRT